MLRCGVVYLPHLNAPIPALHAKRCGLKSGAQGVWGECASAAEDRGGRGGVSIGCKGAGCGVRVRVLRSMVRSFWCLREVIKIEVQQ